MGVNDSQTTTSVIQNTLIRVLNTFMSDQTANCAVTLMTDQRIAFSNVGEIVINGDINIGANTSINFKCLQELTVDATAASKLQSELTSAVTAMTKQLQNLGQVNLSETNTSILQEAVTDLANQFSTTQVSNCITGAVQSQTLDVAFVQKFTSGSINANIDTNLVAECCLQQGAVQKAEADVFSGLGAKSDTSTTQGLDLGSLALIGIFILIVIVLVLFVGPEVIIKALLSIVVAILTIPIELFKAIGSYFESGNKAAASDGSKVNTSTLTDLKLNTPPPPYSNDVSTSILSDVKTT